MAVDRNLVQGSMGMLILRLLEEKDMYGYEMIDTLHSRSNQVFELKAGTLYPLLHTLEDKGYVSSYEETASSGKSRKYYRLTREGKKYLTQKKADWQEYQAAVASVLSRDGGQQVISGLSGYVCPAEGHDRGGGLCYGV